MARAKAKPKPQSITARKARFIAVLRETRNVRRAAKVAKIATSTVYAHRQRYPTFAAAWDDAVAEALDTIEEVLLTRVRDGVEKPVFFRGEQVGSVRTYSDALAMFLLRAWRPETYDRPSAPAPAPFVTITQDAARTVAIRQLDRLAAPDDTDDAHDDDADEAA